MAAPKVSTIIKTVTRRAWHDLEPKLIAFLASGLTATGLVEAAKYAGITLDPGQAGLVVLIVGVVAGYIKASTAKTEIPAEPTPVAVVDSNSPTM
jgi:hypothetical protein